MVGFVYSNIGCNAIGIGLIGHDKWGLLVEHGW